MTGPPVEVIQVILDSVSDGVFTVDLEWRITSFNRAAEKITGIDREAAIGHKCWEVFHASICGQCCSMQQTLANGEPIVNSAVFIVNAGGERIPISVSTAVLKDRRGNAVGGVETFRDLSVVEELRRQLAGRNVFLDIISKNSEMHRLLEMLELVADSDTAVLLEGESGTGKELFARAIHALSHRKNGPLITVNCGAIPDTLLASKLFGYKAGAFTDAKKDKPGRLALAGGGTLLLNEIGDISAKIQVRLLQVLKDNTYEPLGGVTAEKTDARIIAATNKNLFQLIKNGGFRDDLFYRINVVKLCIPPLRKRKEDIPLLLDHFIRKFNSLNDKTTEGVEPEALEILMAYNYPGNVRELENIIEYATVLCKGRYIGIDHLPEHISQNVQGAALNRHPIGDLKRMTFDEMEKHFLSEALRRNRWNRKITAEELGIHPTTLWRKMKRLGIEVPCKSRRSKKCSTA